jgi:hypothetical protein
MIVLMPDTFIMAYLTDLNAFLHDMAGMGGVAGHQAGRQGTHIGTIPVILNAFDHHLYILFLQTERGACLTSRNAFDQYMFQIISSFGFHISWIYC